MKLVKITVFLIPILLRLIMIVFFGELFEGSYMSDPNVSENDTLNFEQSLFSNQDVTYNPDQNPNYGFDLGDKNPEEINDFKDLSDKEQKDVADALEHNFNNDNERQGNYQEVDNGSFPDFVERCVYEYNTQKGMNQDNLSHVTPELIQELKNGIN